MTRLNLEKTISANSHGIIISYGDVHKQQYISYNYVKKIQEKGTTKFQKIEENIIPIQFSIYQKELFNKTIYGFKSYTREETLTMTKQMKLIIMTTYAKVQQILIRWKQDLIFKNIDSLLLHLFPHSPIIKQMTQIVGYTDITDNKDQISFKDLGISNLMIANKLIEYNILPKNFFNLC